VRIPNASKHSSAVFSHRWPPYILANFIISLGVARYICGRKQNTEQLYLHTGRNWKVRINFGHEFHIQKHEKKSVSTNIRKYLICELYLSAYIYNKCSKCAPCDSMQASTRPIMDRRIRSEMPGQLLIIWQASIMRWWSASSLSTGAAYTRVVRCPYSKNAKDSSQVSVEAMQWALLYVFIGRDGGCWEHLAQHGAPSCLYGYTLYMFCSTWNVTIHFVTEVISLCESASWRNCLDFQGCRFLVKPQMVAVWTIIKPLESGSAQLCV
jgi:hypothetical protein